jgi:hypothetical protein
MLFKKEEPWLLWPEVNAYGIDKGDIGSLFNGENDFTISFKLDLIDIESDKKTLFCILPYYIGFDVEGFNLSFILTTIDENNNKVPNYFWFDNIIKKTENIFTISYSKNNKKINVLLDELLLMEKILNDTNFNNTTKTHIIFGAGNFPNNDYNLNYAEYDAKKLIFSKKCLQYNEIIEIFNNEKINEDVIAYFNFEEYTNYKIYDLTGNCNFINKII